MMGEGAQVSLARIAEEARLTYRGGAPPPEKAISGAVCSDLLSFVMASGHPDGVWVTIQTHPNVIAVAALAKMCAVIMASGFEPDEETLTRADEEGIALYTSSASSFAISGKLYELGVR